MTETSLKIRLGRHEWWVELGSGMEHAGCKRTHEAGEEGQHPGWGGSNLF